MPRSVTQLLADAEQHPSVLDVPADLFLTRPAPVVVPVTTARGRTVLSDFDTTDEELMARRHLLVQAVTVAIAVLCTLAAVSGALALGL